MIQNTDNKPISELFSIDNKVKYYIPRYQREYVWGKWNWENIFDDILGSEGRHFLGSIICINISEPGDNFDELELVDGQQRMTTLSLLYLAIFKYLNKYIPDKDDMEEMTTIINLRSRLTIKIDNEKKPVLTPSITNQNYDDYIFLMSKELDLKNNPKKPKFFGLRRIAKCFRYFYDRLEEDNVFSYKAVKQLLEKLNSATVVKIDVANHSDAFVLFETLNNRGVPLTAVDLIKNKLLGELEKQGKGSIDNNFERWNQILMNLSDDYKVQERFLRQFYNAFKVEDEIKVDRIPKATRSTLINIYENLIEKDIELIFNRLENGSQIYRDNLLYETNENSNRLQKALRKLENVNASDAYMLLLFVEKKYNISEEQEIKLINLLCNYFIRRNVTDLPATRRLTNLFIEIIEKLNHDEQYSYDRIRDLILQIAQPASDELFAQNLKSDIYEDNPNAVRFILSSIELKHKNEKEQYINFYEREKNIFVWTIEHILPQGNTLPQHWVDMIAGGDREKAEEIKVNYTHRLGNLTLTGYNSQLSNMSLEKKQNRQKNGINIGFKNGLYVNEDIKDVADWTKENIEERTERLVEEALELFDL